MCRICVGELMGNQRAQNLMVGETVAYILIGLSKFATKISLQVLDGLWYNVITF
jgi:hypothetical protein